MALISLNPATGKRLKSYPETKTKSIKAALHEVNQAQLGWRELSFADRAKVLKRLAKSLEDDLEPLAHLITSEMGKPISEARAEIEKCASCCRHYAKHGAAMLEPSEQPKAPKEAVLRHEPLGIVLAIMPWNFPFWQVFRAAVPALMAGNTVVLKHASNVSGCALAIEELFSANGIPRGLLRTLLIRSDQIPALIADPRIKAVTLTGSTQAGKKVATIAGAHLKPCVFELGGSDPYLILPDADIPKAARCCATARMINAGQSCVAAKRFVAVDSIHDKFIEALTLELAKYVSGNPVENETLLGPLAREDLRDELHAQVRKSIRLGANLLLGGKIPKTSGFYYPATLLTDVTPGMPACDEELFGPVASVIRVPDENAAITCANASVYGLGAAIFSANIKRAKEIARHELQAGMVFINDFVRSHPAVPFGGCKQSGYGRELGTYGIRAFTQPKLIWNPT